MIMHKILTKLRNNSASLKVLNILEYLFLLVYTFSLPAFSARNPLNIISYSFMALLIANTVLLILVNKNIEFKMHLIIIPTFVIWIFIGTLFFSHNFRGAFTLFLLSITMLTFYFSFKAVDNFKYCLYILITAIFIFSLYFIVVYWKSIVNFQTYTNDNFRLGDHFDNVNHIGTYFFLGFALSLYFLLFGKTKEKIIFIAGVLFLLLGMTTGSREFVINIILIVVILMFFKFRKKKWIYLLTLLVVVVLFVVLMNLPFMATMKTRFEKMLIALLGGGGEGSTTTRIMWQIYGVVLGSQNIIPGYGFYGFGVASGIGTYSHANYSEIICNGGLIGFLLFYGYLIYIFYKTSVWNNSYKNFAAALSLTFILSSPVSIYYSSKETYLFFGLMLSIMDTKFNGQLLWKGKMRGIVNNDAFYVVNI